MVSDGTSFTTIPSEGDHMSFVSDSHKVMTAFIVMLPQIFVEVFL